MNDDQDVTYVRGDDLSIPCTVSLDESRALAGTETWRWELKRDVTAPTLISKTSQSGGITVDVSTYQPTIVIENGDFSLLQFPSNATDQLYTHELQMTLASGKVETVLRGSFTVRSDVVS